jgi:hypothetical protein
MNNIVLPTEEELPKLSLDELGQLQSTLAKYTSLTYACVDQAQSKEFVDEFEKDLINGGRYWVHVDKQPTRLIVEAVGLYYIGTQYSMFHYTLVCDLGHDEYNQYGVQLDFCLDAPVPNIPYARALYERCNETHKEVSIGECLRVRRMIRAAYDTHIASARKLVTSLVDDIVEVTT